MKLKFTLKKIQLELKVKWKISRNESSYKENYIVKLCADGDGEIGRGEVAPNIRYGESGEKIEAQFSQLPVFNSLDDILDFLSTSSLSNSLKCGLECAALDLKAKQQGCDLTKLLSLSAVPFVRTSMSIPIMGEGDLESYIKEIARFDTIKIKVDEKNALSLVRRASQLSPRPLRIDANEAFTNVDDYLAFERELKNIDVQFIEQPFPASAVELYTDLRRRSQYKIMADESIEDAADFYQLSKMFDGINIKIMKAGGLLKARELAIKARQYGLEVMLGCMIETSLGISYAMRLAEFADYFDLDGALLIKNDPFQLLKESEGKLTFV